MQIPLTAQWTEKRIERALETFRALLASQGLRMTTVRDAILRAALEHQGHFDAVTLAEGLHSRLRKVSLSAIYRTLPLMVEARLLRPTLLSGGHSHFYEVVFERPPNDHLVCQLCGTVVEFRVEAFAALREAFAALRRDIATMHAFELTPYVDEMHAHKMIGVCATCIAREKNVPEGERLKRLTQNPGERARTLSVAAGQPTCQVERRTQ